MEFPEAEVGVPPQVAVNSIVVVVVEVDVEVVEVVVDVEVLVDVDVVVEVVDVEVEVEVVEVELVELVEVVEVEVVEVLVLVLTAPRITPMSETRPLCVWVLYCSQRCPWNAVPNAFEEMGQVTVMLVPRFDVRTRFVACREAGSILPLLQPIPVTVIVWPM